jgi:hypothetical protein
VREERREVKLVRERKEMGRKKTVKPAWKRHIQSKWNRET